MPQGGNVVRVAARLIIWLIYSLNVLLVRPGDVMRVIEAVSGLELVRGHVVMWEDGVEVIVEGHFIPMLVRGISTRDVVVGRWSRSQFNPRTQV